jgi:hypothetical protein
MEKIIKHERNVSGDWDIVDLIKVLNKSMTEGADKVCFSSKGIRKDTMFLHLFRYKTPEEVKTEKILELEAELKKLKEE